MTYAITVAGQPIYPDLLDPLAWQLLKDTYKVGDVLMPCCSAPAVPKTSINGIQFFAHAVDECKTSPESRWHIDTKEKVFRELALLGASAELEHFTRGEGFLLKSDVYCEFRGRRFAFEIQHSYQSLREYLRRQNKYQVAGIRNVWLIYPRWYLTLTKSISSQRFRQEFGNKFPEGGYFPVIPELPMALYDPAAAPDKSVGGAVLNSSLTDWVRNVLNENFLYRAGAWRVV